MPCPRTAHIGFARALPATLLVLLVGVAIATPAMSGQTGRTAQARTSPDSDEALDLNSATLQQLASLPGMGPNYARRIIEGRPYLAKNQLVNRGVLPLDAYGAIRDRVVAHRTPGLHRAVENSASKGIER